MQVSGEGRIKGTLPTLKHLLDKGAKSIVMISHLGRPDGQANKKVRCVRAPCARERSARLTSLATPLPPPPLPLPVLW